MLLKFSTLLAVALSVVSAPPGTAAAESEDKIRVLLTVGGHDFEQSFYDTFDALEDVQYTKIVIPESADMLKPGLEKEFDVLVMYDMSSGLTKEQQNAFVALLEGGIGLLSLHHNLGAHPDWDEFRNIVGGAFLFKQCTIDGQNVGPSGWEHDQDISVTVIDKQHPVTAGFEDFQIRDEVYSNYYRSPDVKLLLTTNHPKNEHSLAWTTEYGKSQIVYLQFGHDATAWKDPHYGRLIGNSIRWLSTNPLPSK